MLCSGFAASFHGCAKVLRWAQPVLASQQGSLCRKLGTALAATSCKDGTTGTGLHTQTETVSLSATAVVRLKSTLSHLVLLQNFVVEFKSKCLVPVVTCESRAEQPLKLTLLSLVGQVFIKEIFVKIQFAQLSFVTVTKMFTKSVVSICNFIPLSSWIHKRSFPQGQKFAFWFIHRVWFLECGLWKTIRTLCFY